MTRRKPSSPGHTCSGCQVDPLLAGEIKGKLDLVIAGNAATNARLDGLDARLRHVENRSAIAGAVGGALMAVGVNVAAWFLRKQG